MHYLSIMIFCSIVRNWTFWCSGQENIPSTLTAANKSGNGTSDVCLVPISALNASN